MSASVFYLVRVRPADERVVDRALYESTRVAGRESNIPDGRSKGMSVLILQTSATDADSARWLAEYQAGRLQSFPFFTAGPFNTYTEAEQEAGETFDAYPEMVHTRTPSQFSAESLAREFGTDVSEWTV